MWESHALRTRTGSKEGFDSGVSWDQDFTLNERESERPIIKVPDKQGREATHRGKRATLRGGRAAAFLTTQLVGNRAGPYSCLQEQQRLLLESGKLLTNIEAHYYQERPGRSYVPSCIWQAIQRQEITQCLPQRRESPQRPIGRKGALSSIQEEMHALVAHLGSEGNGTLCDTTIK